MCVRSFYSISDSRCVPSNHFPIRKSLLRALPRAEPIRDQRDKLAVGRLIVQRADVLAEGLVQRVDAPAVPRHLDGMANRAFHLAGRRAEAVGNAGIKLLGDAPHQLRVIHHHAHRLAQILIALDVRRDADRQKQVRDALLQRLAARFAALLLNHLRADGFGAQALPRRLIHALGEHHKIKRLDHIIVHAEIHRAGNEIVAPQRRQRDHARLLGQLHRLKPFQNGVTVHLRHNQIADQNIRLTLRHQPQRFHAVARRADHFNAVLLLQILRDHIPELYIVVRNDHTYRIHVRHPPVIRIFLRRAASNAILKGSIRHDLFYTLHFMYKYGNYNPSFEKKMIFSVSLGFLPFFRGSAVDFHHIRLQQPHDAVGRGGRVARGLRHRHKIVARFAKLRIIVKDLERNGRLAAVRPLHQRGNGAA